MKRGIKRFRYSVLASWRPPLLLSHIYVQYNSVQQCFFYYVLFKHCSSAVFCRNFSFAVLFGHLSILNFSIIVHLLCCSNIFLRLIHLIRFKIYILNGTYTLQYMCVSDCTCSAEDKEVFKGNASTNYRLQCLHILVCCSNLARLALNFMASSLS